MATLDSRSFANANIVRIIGRVFSVAGERLTVYVIAHANGTVTVHMLKGKM